jgi:ribosome modulation factor
MSSKRNNEYWRKGYSAYDAGVNLRDNPYDLETDNGAMWHDGWIDAHSDDIQVEEM